MAEANPSAARPAAFENYRIYKSRTIDSTFVVVSTLPERSRKAAILLARGYEEISLRALAGLIQTEWKRRTAAAGVEGAPAVEATLRTHGYNTSFSAFLTQVAEEAGTASPTTTLRPEGRFYFGFRWRSEGLLSGSSLRDTLSGLGATWSVAGLLLLMPLIALAFLRRSDGTWALPGWAETLLWPYTFPAVASVLLGAGLGFLALRVSTYLSDRYRAIHYGAPDLTEFIRDLDLHLGSMGVRVAVDMVGHSMGCLLLVNAVRVMSDFFHFPGQETRFLGMTGSIELRTLILCAPDIPTALAGPGRNNYFLSSIRRFIGVHVLSSDRDIILKWLSGIANWSSEPQYDMSSRRLGNVLLLSDRGVPEPVRAVPHEGDYVPVSRPTLRNYPVGSGRGMHPPGLRSARVHFHDCSACPSVGGDAAWSMRLAAIATAAAALAWVFGGAIWARWLAVWVGILLAGGGICRLAQQRLRDRWSVGAALGLLADWPSIAAFGARRNPHSGYFLAHDEPRKLIARLLAESRDSARDPGRPWARPPIRTSALILPV